MFGFVFLLQWHYDHLEVIIYPYVFTEEICPDISEATLKDIGKTGQWQPQQPCTAWTMCIILET